MKIERRKEQENEKGERINTTKAHQTQHINLTTKKFPVSIERVTTNTMNFEPLPMHVGVNIYVPDTERWKTLGKAFCPVMNLLRGAADVTAFSTYARWLPGADPSPCQLIKPRVQASEGGVQSSRYLWFVYLKASLSGDGLLGSGTWRKRARVPQLTLGYPA